MHMTSNGIRVLVIFCIFVGLSGCNQEQRSAESRYSLLQTTNPDPAIMESQDLKKSNIAAKVKEEVLSLEEVYDVAIVKGKQDILVAYKVKHLQRFRMKKIEGRITKLLEKNHPKENFTVSSDYKIFLEAVELKEYMDEPDYSEAKAEKKLQHIIKLKNELT